ncbi:hypothetical protein [Halorientalis salina]|uniref:hypothetical protein n=1 Tax=Halorientalis salina TaxID=2932266 RepID=UPI0010ABD03E|nr:hypothetical protein [Halorientalis salina]
MATQVPHIEPTHVLVLGGLDDPERDALVSCHTAVLAALDHATSVDVYLDADHIAGVSLGSLADIGEAFDLVADGQYRGEIPEGAAHLAQLLDVRQFEEIAAVEGIVLRRADIPFLVYRPDDRLVELDASRTDDAVEDIQRETGDYPVGLFEATPIVQWRADGREYALDPPAVTVDDAAFSLSNLASVTLDRERRRIHLAWDATERGFLSRLAARFRPSRPTTLAFEDDPAFERIAQEFESVGETLGVLSGDGIDRF